MIFDDKHVLVTGGTGSLGQTVVRRILSGELGTPKRLTVFSRDEAKQYQMRVNFHNLIGATDEIIFHSLREILDFEIGDIRDYDSVCRVVKNADIVIHAAALKQVPTCELFPYEAVKTNVGGAENLVRAIRDSKNHVEQVVGISTDKACKPINAMGMTKALMERIFVEANRHCENTRFNLVRYGNVIASRGSVIPLFVEQIARGGPVTITVKQMTRFLLTLDEAVNCVFEALRHGKRGETFVPKVGAAKIIDVARALMGGDKVPIIYTGIRPGEKIHEILVSKEECWRTIERGNYYVIQPMLEVLEPSIPEQPVLSQEYSSENTTLDCESILKLIEPILSSPPKFSKVAA